MTLLGWMRNAVRVRRVCFGTGLSIHSDPERAAAEAADGVRAGLGADPPTLVVAFASPELTDRSEALLAAIDRRLAPAALVGCSGEAIIGEGREVEEGPALSLWAARLPGARITPFHLSAETTEEGLGVAGWPVELEQEPAPDGPVIMLADPFTFPADALLAQLNLDRRGVTVVGGLASGGRGPGEHRLFVGEQAFDEGAVGAVVRGARMLTVVSQGCAPVGPDLVITDAEGSTIHELAGRPALERLREVVAGLGPHEHERAAEGLLVGLVIDENRPEYRRGDYLVRGIHGADPETGNVYVGERVRIGQTLRFHVRDAASADDDLRAALRRAREQLGGPGASGGLVFTCNGRGSGLFGRPDHDATAIREELDGLNAAGFFCNGEIGPVGGRNFLHGFTATMALFASNS
jgi:small ligand-binding sensory domain FIST